MDPEEGWPRVNHLWLADQGILGRLAMKLRFGAERVISNDELNVGAGETEWKKSFK